MIRHCGGQPCHMTDSGCEGKTMAAGSLLREDGSGSRRVGWGVGWLKLR